MERRSVGDGPRLGRTAPLGGVQWPRSRARLMWPVWAAGSLILLLFGATGCTPSAAGTSGFLSEAPCAVRARYTLEVQQDLQAMLKLLDADDYGRFLADYMDPRVVERLNEGTGGMFQEEFAESALARELHAAIRTAISAEPSFGKDVDLATFDQPEAGRRLMLRRMEGRWRVLD